MKTINSYAVSRELASCPMNFLRETTDNYQDVLDQLETD